MSMSWTVGMPWSAGFLRAYRHHASREYAFHAKRASAAEIRLQADGGVSPVGIGWQAGR